jgi:hypothetical protein
VRYTVTAKVSATPPSTITNAASTTAPTGGTCNPCTASVTSSLVPSGPPVQTPTFSVWTLLLLLISVATSGAFIARRQRCG